MWQTLVIAIGIGNKLLKRLITTTHKHQQPWRHWITDDFLTVEALAELKAIPVKAQQAQPGRRVGSERFVITPGVHSKTLPYLCRLYDDLCSGPVRQFFEVCTGKNFSGLYLRLEVISDWGDFSLTPHHDHLEKKLSAMIYTDHQQLYPGTALSDGSRVESRDNRCFFFVPDTDTVHSYPATHFDQVRRCLMINYWTYNDPIRLPDQTIQA
jgi:hypothetical protein